MKEQILAVQRMQDFIENNKSEEISLSDLARASLFSPWYAYRLFRDYLGLTPTEYIRKYRLTQAAKQLRSGEVKVIDAAYDAGFANVDTFTRAFYREFGLNPSDYMKDPVPLTFFIPYGAKYRELRKENIDVSNIQPIFIQIIRRPERLCIIKRGRGLLSLLQRGQLRRVGHPHEYEVALWGTRFHVAAAQIQRTEHLHLCAGRRGRNRLYGNDSRGLRHHSSAGNRISDVPRPALPRGRLLRGNPHCAGSDEQL